MCSPRMCRSHFIHLRAAHSSRTSTMQGLLSRMMCGFQLLILLGVSLKVEAFPLVPCALDDTRSYEPDTPKFKIESHSSRDIITVLQNRSLATITSQRELELHRPTVWFSPCNSSINPKHLARNSRFTLCQAGYPKRHLIFHALYYQFMVLPKLTNHDVAGIIVPKAHVQRACRPNQTTLCPEIQIKFNLTRDVIEVLKTVDHYGRVGEFHLTKNTQLSTFQDEMQHIRLVLDEYVNL